MCSIYENRRTRIALLEKFAQLYTSFYYVKIQWEKVIRSSCAFVASYYLRVKDSGLDILWVLSNVFICTTPSLTCTQALLRLIA